MPGADRVPEGLLVRLEKLQSVDDGVPALRRSARRIVAGKELDFRLYFCWNPVTHSWAVPPALYCLQDGLILAGASTLKYEGAVNAPVRPDDEAHGNPRSGIGGVHEWIRRGECLWRAIRLTTRSR